MMNPTSSSQRRKAQSQSSRNRLKGLIKKASEFSILCDVQLCMICYPPNSNSTGEPTTMPKDRPAVEKLVARYSAAKNGGSIKQIRSPEDYENRRSSREEPCAELPRAWQPAFEHSLWHPELDKCSEEMLRCLLLHLEEKLLMVNLEIMKPASSFSSKAVNVTAGADT